MCPFNCTIVVSFVTLTCMHFLSLRGVFHTNASDLFSFLNLLWPRRRLNHITNNLAETIIFRCCSNLNILEILGGSYNKLFLFLSVYGVKYRYVIYYAACWVCLIGRDAKILL